MRVALSPIPPFTLQYVLSQHSTAELTPSPCFPILCFVLCFSTHTYWVLQSSACQSTASCGLMWSLVISAHLAVSVGSVAAEILLLGEFFNDFQDTMQTDFAPSLLLRSGTILLPSPSETFDLGKPWYPLLCMLFDDVLQSLCPHTDGKGWQREPWLLHSLQILLPISPGTEHPTFMLYLSEILTCQAQLLKMELKPSAAHLAFPFGWLLGVLVQRTPERTSIFLIYLKIIYTV